MDASRYRYFIVMNTSVRGPLLPAYLERRMDRHHALQCHPEDGTVTDRSAHKELSMKRTAWNDTQRASLALSVISSANAATASSSALSSSSSVGGPSPASASSPSTASSVPLSTIQHYFSWFDVLMDLLTREVRYAGCTISCTAGAHVQSYVVAMDFVGLQVLWQTERSNGVKRRIHVTESYEQWQSMGGLPAVPRPGRTFACSRDHGEANQQETGASQAMLRAGYNIASLSRVFHDVDFCAGKATPTFAWPLGPGTPPWGVSSTTTSRAVRRRCRSTRSRWSSSSVKRACGPASHSATGYWNGRSTRGA